MRLGPRQLIPSPFDYKPPGCFLTSAPAPPPPPPPSQYCLQCPISRALIRSDTHCRLRESFGIFLFFTHAIGPHGCGPRKGSSHPKPGRPSLHVFVCVLCVIKPAAPTAKSPRPFNSPKKPPDCLRFLAKPAHHDGRHPASGAELCPYVHNVDLAAHVWSWPLNTRAGPFTVEVARTLTIRNTGSTPLAFKVEPQCLPPPFPTNRPGSSC